MTDDDICFTDAHQLLRMYRAGDLSPVEVVNAVVERIAARKPDLNAFATFTPEIALEQARRAEIAWQRGEPCGALCGVPITIKDLADTAGVATQYGSFIHEGRVPDEDTAVAARLKAAGGALLGKTTTSEFGWKGVSQSPLTGITSNPWRSGYNAGASSAGAGAGAAAGYGPLHHGTDGAGSVRMPAHFCGVFGLKPTFGRVPNVPVRNNDQTSHHGVLTRTVADAALMLDVMAGAHPLDHYSLETATFDYAGALDGGVQSLRVAYSPALGHARVDDEVAAVVADAVNHFASLGVNVEAVDPPFGPQGPEIARFLWAAHELWLLDHLDAFGDRIDPGLVACMRSAEQFSAADYVRMRARKLAYVESVHRFFESWDLLLTPAVSVAAFPAERLQPAHWPEHPWDWLMWAEFSYPFNLSGNPAASVPAGFTEDGLPVGLQIVGRRFEEATVLRASAAFEAANPWAARRPD